MTLSQQFVETWQNRKATHSVATLVKRVDPQVKIERIDYPLCFTYIFTDGSIARSEGKGRHFNIWCRE